jgi:hypothetical protein
MKSLFGKLTFGLLAVLLAVLPLQADAGLKAVATPLTGPGGVLPGSQVGNGAPVLTATNMIVHGDSLTTGNGATGTCNNGFTSCWYAALLAYDSNVSLTNDGVSGTQACDLAYNDVLAAAVPTLDHNSIQTIMIGTNDANLEGVGAYETAVFKPCHQAALSWLSVAAPYKIPTSTAANCTTTGTWATTSGFAVTGETSDTNGSTLSCTETTYGGPLYAWYRLTDGSGGTFNYAVDGGQNVSLTTATTPAINTQNGGTNGWGLIRIPIAGGSHTIVFTITSATSSSNYVTVLAIGTNGNQNFYDGPLVFSGGVPKQQGDAKSAATAAYNADALADQQLLYGDGLPVYFVNVRNYLCTSVVSTTCYNSAGTADMYDTYHPNNTGHNDLKQAWEAVMQFATQQFPSNPISVGTTVNPTNPSNYSNFNNTPLQSTTSLNQGILVYNNNPNAWGWDFGWDSTLGGYFNRFFAPHNDNIFEACNYASGSYPTAQSSFNNCPLRVASGTIYKGVPEVSLGNQFTISGCSASVLEGGSTSGAYSSGTSGTCTVTITFGGSGFSQGVNCIARDVTTQADTQTQTGALSASTATITGTTVSGDVISFSCPQGY